ncbi:MULTISPECIES: AMP-binding protein [Bradyrhizobium]|uniref:AMP-dependent synthetase n=1 Tax=Bradyrhizobium elkanii TaxID=29448 RepID=A0A4U6S8W4_BRAEL|nr:MULTISPECIES: AMP-binding protein [Bradyrhizobium]MTV18920.1 AMP-dependent synthetase [Bradyrhizobium sp. BR2003]TKV83543.1 AMP-dependent synthetase [Bradyrhizobium elkanii]
MSAPNDTLEQPLHEMLRRHARGRPEKPACIWYGRAITFLELDRASDAFAARLQQLGVDKGEPVALFMNNCPQYLMAQYGIQKIGAIASPCGALNKEHELAYQLDDLGARVIVAAEPLLPIVNQVRDKTKLEHVFVVRYADLLPEQPPIGVPDELLAFGPERAGTSGEIEDFLSVAASGASPRDVAIDMNDTALMIYTSGSTGRPKGAMLSYRNVIFKTAATVNCNGIGTDDVLLSIAPLYHIAGMVMGVNAPVYAGATSVLLFRFDPLVTAQAIDRYQVSWWYSVAPMNVAITQLPNISDFGLRSLRVNPVTSFGIDWTEALARQWQAVAPNCESFEAAYGLTETHTVDTFMPRNAIRWGTHGRPVPGNEIRIVDPDSGADKPADVPGEIVIRGPGVFKGYRNRPDATAETLRNGWLHTGDMGRVDAGGYLTFMGRFKEMIKVSGYSVFPEEVESILNKHPDVAASAVIGVPDATRGEVVKAFVVLAPRAELDTARLVAWARQNMAPYKVPRDVSFVTELPRSPAGKLLRRLLKD